MEGYTHQASMIILDAEIGISSAKETIAELLHTKEGIDFGITAVSINGIIIRIFGNKAEQLHDCLQKITLLMRKQNKPAAIL